MIPSTIAAGTIIQTERGFSSCLDELLERARRRLDVRVVGLQVVPALAQAVGHARAHAPQSHHSELHLEVLQSDSNDGTAALLQRGEVAGRLGADQLAEAEVLAGDRDLVAVSSTIWTKRPIGGPPLCS